MSPLDRAAVDHALVDELEAQTPHVLQPEEAFEVAVSRSYTSPQSRGSLHDEYGEPSRFTTTMTGSFTVPSTLSHGLVSTVLDHVHGAGEHQPRLCARRGDVLDAVVRMHVAHAVVRDKLVQQFLDLSPGDGCRRRVGTNSRGAR